jgi:hypothetical protein
MNRYLRAALGSASLTAIVAGTAVGQKTYALGLGGGATVPVGKLGDAQKTGYNGLVSLAIGVAELPLGVRFDAMYNTMLKTDALVPAPGGGTASSADLRVGALLANLLFAFPGTNAKAYILAGGGLYNSKLDVSGTKAQNNFGFNAGLGNAGLGITFGSGPFAFFIESRYHSVSRSAAKGGVYQFVPITLGILF